MKNKLQKIFKPKINPKFLLLIFFIIFATIVGLYFHTKSNLQNTQISNSINSVNSPIPSPTREKATVKRVIDGDTIELSDNRRVRYIGINTPELANNQSKAECFGQQAKDFNQQLVGGQTIEMEKDVSDTDKYGRLLRYIYADDLFINEFLVQQGFARIESIFPDIKYAKQITSAENEAKNAKRGLWETCGNQ